MFACVDYDFESLLSLKGDHLLSKFISTFNKMYKQASGNSGRSSRNRSRSASCNASRVSNADVNADYLDLGNTNVDDDVGCALFISGLGNDPTATTATTSGMVYPTLDKNQPNDPHLLVPFNEGRLSTPVGQSQNIVDPGEPVTGVCKYGALISD